MPKVWYHEEGFDYYELVDATDEELKENFELGGGFFDQTLEDYIAVYRKKEAEKLKKLEERAQKAREEALKHPSSQQEAQPEIKSLFSPPKSPPKDVNADKRAEYAQKIMRREDAIDALRNLEGNFQERNEQFISDAGHYFEESEEYFYNTRSSSRRSQWQQNALQDTYSHLKDLTNQQHETLEASCRTARREMEDEIDALHKERNALPW